MKFKQRLKARGYPENNIERSLSGVNFASLPSKEARFLLVVLHFKSTNHSTLFYCLHGWPHTHTHTHTHTLRVWHVIILNASSANSNNSIKIAYLQYDQLRVVMEDFRW